jgi:APA family basic amino acid/polyamine antiporter
VLTAVNWFGVTRTASAARVIVVISLGALAAAVTAAFSAGPAPEWLSAESLWSGGAYGILQSAGLLFFAFAGYARIATMGEEVRDPRRVIPRAIVIAFAIAFAVYAVVAVAVLGSLGPAAVAASTEPVADAAARSGWAWIDTAVRVGAAAASLGALLALIAGVSRTTFAMARERDLPRFLDGVHPRWHVPHRAELVVAAVVVVLVALVDLRGAIGFSSFGVLLYYFVANVAAFRQRGDARRYPAALQILGGVGCLVLAVTLPWPSVAAGAVVVAVGVAYRALRLRIGRA